MLVIRMSVPLSMCLILYSCIHLSIHLSVCLSFCLSYVCLCISISGVNINRFSPNLVCALILWRSSLWLLILSVFDYCTSIHLYFPIWMINWINFLWIFTKLGMCIDIVEIWFGIANMQISSTFDRVICLPHDSGWVISHFYFLNSLLTQHNLYTYISYNKSYIHRGERLWKDVFGTKNLNCRSTS